MTETIEPHCTLKCPNPNTIWTNWQWNCNDSEFKNGSQCNGICKWTNTLQAVINCDSSGNWDDRYMKNLNEQCLQFKCNDHHFNLDHGSLQCDIVTHMKTCVLKCDNGYVPRYDFT